MTEQELRAAIMRRMADGRERTIDDIGHYVKAPPEVMRSVLKSMSLRGELQSTHLQQGGKTYNLYRKPQEALDGQA